jgi:hypothetical protein
MAPRSTVTRSDKKLGRTTLLVVFEETPRIEIDRSQIHHFVTMSYPRDEDSGGEEEEEEVAPQVAELARASVPAALKGIRACKRCGILKTWDQFLQEGCENCPFLELVRWRSLAPPPAVVFGIGKWGAEFS